MVGKLAFTIAKAALTTMDDHKLVGDIYDAALGLMPWHDIANQLVRHLDALTMMLLVHDPNSQSVDVVTTLGLSSEALQQYGDYYAQHDLWVLAARQKARFGQALLGTQVVEERVLEQSLFYYDWLRPLDMFHLAGAMLKTVDGNHAVVGLQRPRTTKAYTKHESHRLARLLPHIQRAMEIRQRLAQSESGRYSLLAALDHMALGVILIARTGRIVHLNSAADAILDSNDGLTRTPEGLRAAHRDEDKRLHRLLNEARLSSAALEPTRSAGGHLRISRPSGRKAYALMIAPIASTLGFGSANAPSALVFIAEPETSPLDTAVLTELFRFTPSEAQLVSALLAGTTLPEFARKRQLSYNTIRTLLTRAMARTDTHSQVDLVRLVMSALGTTNLQNKRS
ncbi:helix-turn-helix transcriptional regulator [Reyranella sp.]|uniref:helix-turn-helix transcriptional regulator n=1 Tax=Reyranella sp. TaxID=1929291 RepID=UPI0037850EC0